MSLLSGCGISDMVSQSLSDAKTTWDQQERQGSEISAEDWRQYKSSPETAGILAGRVR